MLYDILFLIIAVLFTIIGAKCGFSRFLSRLISVIAAFFISLIVAHLLAELIYSAFIRGSIISNINSASQSLGVSSALDSAGKLLSAFPEFLANTFAYFGIDQTSLAALFTDSALESIEQLLKTPIVGLITIILFILLFGLILFLCSKLFGALFKVLKLPVIRIFDTLAGGACGLLEGLLIVYIITLTLKLIIPLSDGQWMFINESYIAESLVFSKLYFGGITNFLQSTIFSFNAI
ncbi:MAG: hypothetical protein E7532_08280 [Ruminococcaceae bacterium]|nr:hypothetical protein [Oscillospiraceae bacterium]